MKKQILGCITVAALAAVVASEQQNNGFPQPANTVPVNFTIDASGRKDFYADEDLEWKGSFTFDKETRVLTYSADWAGGAGPYAPLYDDGPWTKGGHEPEGATAGDDKFGITAFVAVPTEALKIEYGAQTEVRRLDLEGHQRRDHPPRERDRRGHRRGPHPHPRGHRRPPPDPRHQEPRQRLHLRLGHPGRR